MNKNKTIRKAVRCYLIKEDKIAVIKYRENNLKPGYYDIPGGKIENGETPEKTVIREMKEETGLTVKNPIYKGNMIVEYPTRIYDFDVFFANESEGNLQQFEENTSEWIRISDLLQKERLLANILILNHFFIETLTNSESNNFYMYINTTEDDKILNMKFNFENSEENKIEEKQ